MSGATEFSGQPLVVGTIRGVRSFTVDTDGWLRGVTFWQTWRPGTNDAVCCLDDVAGSMARFTHAIRGGGAIAGATLEPGISPRSRHEMTACTHGFYAYYDGSNDFGCTDRVTAVIEGYGETVVGTRGFRSMKARILALHIPDQPATTGRPGMVQAKTKRRLRRLPLALWGSLALLDLALGIAKAMDGDPFLATSYLASSVIVGAIAWIEARRPGPGSSYTVTLSHEGTTKRPLTAEVIRRLQMNYPDVPIYRTESELLAAFPPDSHHGRTA